MKKLRCTVNHYNKVTLTYFFRAVFINIYFKTDHSNKTFHLGFYSLSNISSYRKHIRSESNINVLSISGKKRNIKIIVPSAPILLSTLSFHGILSIFPDGHFIMTPPPYFKIFFWNTHLPVYSNPPTIKLRRVTE